MKEQFDSENGQITFEQAIEQLEGIVQTLENGNTSLEESLQLFEKGINLINYCQKKIAKAEQKISVLVQKNEGVFLEPYSNEELEE